MPKIPTVVFSLRLPPEMKDKFEKKCLDQNIDPRTRVKAWIQTYVDNGMMSDGVVAQSSTGSPLNDFMTRTNITQNMFTLTTTPYQYFSEAHEYAWLFGGEGLIEYLRHRAEDTLSVSGWFLDHWLWTFVWCWVTIFSSDLPIPVDSLLEPWLKGDDPVETTVRLGNNKGKADELTQLLKCYMNDPEKEERW